MTSEGSTFYAYKARKEAFVSGLTGTTVSHLMVVLLVMPVSTLLGTCAMETVARRRKDKLVHPNAAVVFAVDFCCTVIPVLTAFTFTEWTPLLLSSMVTSAGILEVVNR